MARRRAVKLPPPMEMRIERMSHEGRGIGYLDDKAVFVEGALPDETVRVQVKRRKKTFAEAQVLDVIEASRVRVTPPCESADICGGCSLQHLSVDKQREHKQAVLKEQLIHFGSGEPKQGFFLPIVPRSTLGYRRKARLAVKFVAKKAQALVGFREKHSHFVADIPACEVLQPVLGHQITQLKALVTKMTARAAIPQIEIAVGDDYTALVVRHLEPLSADDQQLWLAYCQELGCYLYWQPGGLESLRLAWSPKLRKAFEAFNEVCDGEWEPLHYQLPEYQLTFAFHPLDFIQVNSDINQKMIAKALSLLSIKPDESVLDLFCGLGNFSLPMAQQAKQVIGVEGSESLVKRAQDNAQANGIENAAFYAADLYRPNAAQHYMSAPWWRAFDVVLIDPPRSGAESILSFVAQVVGPSRMLYVACNSATLARDINILCHHGYQLVTAGIADMFPHTAHVECIALLVKSSLKQANIG